ncbi:MAG: amino acid permease [Bacteroidia bacterium]|nr:amino acid permease [Bacteroidia bacterium]
MKKLNLTDCIMLISGSMIGSGIFIVPATMALELQSPILLILAWIVTALLTVFAALSYGELAALMPKAGGQYVYLREAYNKLIGFLYGWTLFTVIQTGTIAAVAVAFANYTGVFFPSIADSEIIFQFGVFSISTKQVLAIAVVWILSWVNFRGLQIGALVQNFFTFTKIGALVVMILAGLYFILTNQPKQIDWSLPSTFNYSALPTIFGAALVGSIFSSDAWNNVTFTGSEIENPKRVLPLSLFIGTLGVLLIYIFINYIYLYCLSYDAIATAKDSRVGTLLLNTIFGNIGMWIMAALIMVSTFGCINGLTLSGARVYYAMALDGLFFKKASELNKNEVPQFSLIIQAIWTSILALSGGYNQLLDYVVIAVMLFYILTVAGVIILRKKQPNTERPYKVWGYPVIPILYILLALFVCISLLIEKPATTLPGILIVLLGIPIYYLIIKSTSKN